MLCQCALAGRATPHPNPLPKGEGVRFLPRLPSRRWLPEGWARAACGARAGTASEGNGVSNPGWTACSPGSAAL